MTERKYDAIIIGTGQGGHPLAKELANAGWKVAVVEKGPVGGSCVNEGCTPTKTMVASARVAHLVNRAADYGINVDSFWVDMTKVRERKRNIVFDFSNGSQRSLDALDNIDLYFGAGSFNGPNKVKVSMNRGGTEELVGEKIFINTGTRNFVPPFEGIDKINFLDNASIMELDDVPEHLIVIGGGYIGLEFGQMFRRFGSQVTIVQRGSQLLDREDPDLAHKVLQVLREDGIEVILDAEAKRVSQTGQELTLDLKTLRGDVEIKGSHLLVAAGRIPNTDALNLSSIGVELDSRGYIPVNDTLETSADGVYVIGDAKGGPGFTHISYDDFRILRENLLRDGNASIANRVVPYAVFIDPQLGRVGLSEKDASQQGIEYRVAKLPMDYVARAIEMDETRGFMKVLVDAKTDQILGAAILGVEGGEIMSVLQMAMMGNIPYTRIKDGVFAHPTLAESLNNLFMSFDA